MAKTSGFNFKTSESKWRSGVTSFKDLGSGKLKLKCDVWTPDGTHEEIYEFSDKVLPDTPKAISTEVGYYYTVFLLDESLSEIERFDRITPNRFAELLVLPVEMTRPSSDEPPAAYGPDSYGREKINVFLEIQEGEFAGQRVKYNLLHKFTKGPNNLAMFDFTEKTLQDSKSTRIQEFFEFWVTLTEVFTPEWPLEWPDDGNVYPELLARLLDKRPYLRITGKGAFVTDMWKESNPPVPAVAQEAFEVPVKEEVETPAPVPSDW